MLECLQEGISNLLLWCLGQCACWRSESSYGSKAALQWVDTAAAAAAAGAQSALELFAQP
jgi:hypothetical protein